MWLCKGTWQNKELITEKAKKGRGCHGNFSFDAHSAHRSAKRTLTGIIQLCSPAATIMEANSRDRRHTIKEKTKNKVGERIKRKMKGKLKEKIRKGDIKEEVFCTLRVWPPLLMFA
jgi:hypothetical protein